MKSIVVAIKSFVLFQFLLINICLGQGIEDIPRSVKIQFMEDYVSASSVKWQENEDGTYLAKFTHQSQEKSSAYTPTGEQIVVVTKLTSLFQVPGAVSDAISKRLKKWMIDQIALVQTPTEIAYEFILFRGADKYYIKLSPQGKIRMKKKMSGRSE